MAQGEGIIGAPGTQGPPGQPGSVGPPGLSFHHILMLSYIWWHVIYSKGTYCNFCVCV